ncbi:MAG: hypothetical protein M1839_001366 [Geoglossum umbratile]|nr:MAG: hypothetical protein M1839_001366 [Geoglossum umbratile]
MSKSLHQLPSPPPQTSQAQTPAGILDAYSNAASLFHAYEYHQAIKAYKRLLRQEQDLISETLIWFNIGVLRDHLGEHALAAEAYEKAIKLDKSLSIGWFSLGNAISLLGNFRRALRVFKICEKTLQGDSIDYHQQGLPWTLEKTRVIFNIRQTELRKLHKQHKAPLDRVWSLNRLPAGKIFELSTTETPGNTEDTKPPPTLPEPRGAKLVEQTRAEARPLPAVHNKLRRSATAWVADPRKPPTAQGKLGRSATARIAIPQKPVLDESNTVTGTPQPFGSAPALQNWEKQSFNNQYQAVRPPDSQRGTNTQSSSTGTKYHNKSLPGDTRHERVDSFSIFALGEPQLRELRARANEASAVGRSRSLMSRIPFVHKGTHTGSPNS